MTDHKFSLNPARFSDETQEEYRERRAKLTKMAKRAGNWGLLTHNNGKPIVNKRHE